MQGIALKDMLYDFFCSYASAEGSRKGNTRRIRRRIIGFG